MSSCQRAKDIIAYQLGLLSSSEKKRFEDHLNKCPVCQQEMQVESIIKEELAQKLQPGKIEQRVLANLRFRQSLAPQFSWLYIIRMGIYALAMMTGAFVIIPWLLEYPISRLLNLNINFNPFSEIAVLSNIFNHPFIFAFFILILVGASTVYSYKLLRE